jgi:hypothetical protein
MPMPAQESVEATVARLSGALRTSTVKPSLSRVFFAGRGRFGSVQATGTATATGPTAAA